MVPTLLKVRDELFRLRARADALGEASVVLAGIEEDAVDKITVVVSNRDERDLVIATPARDVQSQVSLFIRNKRESS
jgi:predicted transcriptional regulator